MGFQKFFNALVDLVYPNICVGCDNYLSGNEKYICTECLTSLPYTNYWLHDNNPIEELFWGRVHLEAAASFVYFEKDTRFQNILHQLKYKQKEEIGTILGNHLGRKLLNTKFNKIDLIVPVPLHKSREHERGYNQSEKFASGIGKALNKPVISNAVKRTKATKTQTHKTRYQRWLNVENVFKVVQPGLLLNKHILVVDDVITTGATTESIIAELLKLRGVNVSVVALASA